MQIYPYTKCTINRHNSLPIQPNVKNEECVYDIDNLLVWNFIPSLLDIFSDLLFSFFYKNHMWMVSLGYKVHPQQN